jgi:serine/threonine protein kinase
MSDTPAGEDVGNPIETIYDVVLVLFVLASVGVFAMLMPQILHKLGGGTEAYVYKSAGSAHRGQGGSSSSSETRVGEEGDGRNQLLREWDRSKMGVPTEKNARSEDGTASSREVQMDGLTPGGRFDRGGGVSSPPQPPRSPSEYEQRMAMSRRVEDFFGKGGSNGHSSKGGTLSFAKSRRKNIAPRTRERLHSRGTLSPKSPGSPRWGEEIPQHEQQHEQHLTELRMRGASDPHVDNLFPSSFGPPAPQAAASPVEPSPSAPWSAGAANRGRSITEPQENLALHCQTDMGKEEVSATTSPTRAPPNTPGSPASSETGPEDEVPPPPPSSSSSSSSTTTSSPPHFGKKHTGLVFDQSGGAYAGQFKYRASKRGRACIGGNGNTGNTATGFGPERSPTLIPNTSFIIGRRMGKPGGQGVVFEACDPTTKRVVAVKVSPNNAVSKLEVALMKRLSHRNILPVLDAQFGRGNIYTLLEHCPGGDLYEQLVKTPGARFAPEVAKRYFADMVGAVAHCHRHGIAHRDVKLENLLLDGQGRVILADFGSACDIRSSSAASAGGVVGTKEYVAPEVLKLGHGGGGHQGGTPRGAIPVGMVGGHGHSHSGALSRRGKALDFFSTDVWSLGVVLYAMMEGRLPFRQAQLPDSSFAALQKNKFYFPRHFPDPACNILNACLQIQPSRRTNIWRIECHPWLQPHQTTRGQGQGHMKIGH